MEKILSNLGLTQNESKVYLALMELGPSKAGIISKKSRLHRRVVYDCLEMLVNKGMAGYITKNGTKLFSGNNPDKLKQILKEKEETLDSIMPLLNQLFLKTKEKEETNFFKGINGLKSVMEDQLNYKEIKIISSGNYAYETLQYYFKWYDKRRVKGKIKVKIILNNKSKNNIPLSEIRYMPEKYASPLSINIYGDKIALIYWSKDNPIAIVIKNKEISKGYEKYFLFYWNKSKK